MLSSSQLPLVLEAPAVAGAAAGLQVVEAVTDEVMHRVTVSYIPGNPLPHSISAVSPPRGQNSPHEVFVGKKVAGVGLGRRAYTIWMPALYASVEIRVGIGAPVEFVTDRIMVDQFSPGTIDPPPLPEVPEIYIEESNVPKVFPREVSRFFPHQCRFGLWMDLVNAVRFNDATYLSFSVLNCVPLFNLSYAIEARCSTHGHQVYMDRQFWFSRDEIIVVAPTDCEQLTLALWLIFLPQVGLFKLGRVTKPIGRKLDEITVAL